MPTGLQEPKKGGFEIFLSNRLVVKFFPSLIDIKVVSVSRALIPQDCIALYFLQEICPWARKKNAYFLSSITYERKCNHARV